MNISKCGVLIKKNSPIICRVSPGFTGPSPLFDPNVILPEELWRMIMEDVTDPKDKRNLANASSRLSSLFNEDKCNWLFPLILPILMRECGTKDVLSWRLVSFQSLLAIDRTSTEDFSKIYLDNCPHGYVDMDDRPKKYRTPMALLDLSLSRIKDVNACLTARSLLQSTRIPPMTRFVQIYPRDETNDDELHLSVELLQQYFQKVGSNLKGLFLNLWGTYEWAEVDEIFTTVFANCVQVERMCIGFEFLGIEICEGEDVFVLPPPPPSLKALKLDLNFFNGDLSPFLYKNIFKQLERLYAEQILFSLREEDLTSLGNLRFLQITLGHVKYIDRQELYQGLLNLHCPSLDEIEFICTYFSRRKQSFNHLKKRLQRIVQRKYPHRTCCYSLVPQTVEGSHIQWATNVQEKFTILLK